jgi:hypothetical protein
VRADGIVGGVLVEDLGLAGGAGGLLKLLLAGVAGDSLSPFLTGRGLG